MNSTPSS